MSVLRGRRRPPQLQSDVVQGLLHQRMKLPVMGERVTFRTNDLLTLKAVGRAMNISHTRIQFYPGVKVGNAEDGPEVRARKPKLMTCLTRYSK